MASAFFPRSPLSMPSHLPPMRHVPIFFDSTLPGPSSSPERPKPSPESSISRRPHATVRTGAFSSARWKICVWELFVSFRAQNGHRLMPSSSSFLLPLFPPALPTGSRSCGTLSSLSGHTGPMQSVLFAASLFHRLPPPPFTAFPHPVSSPLSRTVTDIPQQPSSRVTDRLSLPLTKPITVSRGHLPLPPSR
jgi:hypothetical protein